MKRAEHAAGPIPRIVRRPLRTDRPSGSDAHRRWRTWRRPIKEPFGSLNAPIPGRTFRRSGVRLRCQQFSLRVFMGIDMRFKRWGAVSRTPHGVCGWSVRGAARWEGPGAMADMRCAGSVLRRLRCFSCGGRPFCRTAADLSHRRRNRPRHRGLFRPDGTCRPHRRGEERCGGPVREGASSARRRRQPVFPDCAVRFQSEICLTGKCLILI